MNDTQRLAEAAEVVLDPRLTEVWQVLWALDGQEADVRDPAPTQQTLGCLLRLAYLQGYADARAEPDDDLYRALGVRAPPATKPARRRRAAQPRSDSSGT